MAANYDRMMEAEIEKLRRAGQTPPLLLHSCCGPCSSAVLARLGEHFRTTVYFYNPNIAPEDEYSHRLEEQRRLISLLGRPVGLISGPYDSDAFLRMARGLEDEPEGGRRCLLCYRLRLEETAKLARREGYAYFTTTLSVSPHKRAEALNEIGQDVAGRYGVAFLPADFKKRGGYQASAALSRAYGLYRQKYCGCPFSMRGATQR